MFSKTLFIRNAAVVLSALVAQPMAAEASSDESDDPKWCRACHDTGQFDADRMAASVHTDLTCRDCHTGYHFNPHETVNELDEDVAAAFASHSERAPTALAACVDCHDDITDDANRMVHGDASTPEAAPFCLDCHGDPHVIIASDESSAGDRRRTMNARCVTCHADDERMEVVGLHTEPVRSYQESVHSRKLLLGSERAPGCADCHGGHEQTDLPAGITEQCRTCHDSANAVFASLATHAPLTAATRPVGYYTQKFFAWLTFIVIMLLALHVVLDLATAIRKGSRKVGAEG